MHRKDYLKALWEGWFLNAGLVENEMYCCTTLYVVLFEFVRKYGSNEVVQKVLKFGGKNPSQDMYCPWDGE